MSIYGMMVNVPMDFTEDDAMKVLNRTFDKLIRERYVARGINIRRKGGFVNEYDPASQRIFSFNAHFVVISTIRNRIHTDVTIDFRISKEFRDCYVETINEVSENLYNHMQDCIKMIIRSSKIEANSVYGLYAGPAVFDEFMAVRRNYIKPMKVIFNNPATIVLWSDGTKTVVKRQRGDRYNKEAGLALCYVKKFCGDNTSRGLNDILKLANDKEEK